MDKICSKVAPNILVNKNNSSKIFAFERELFVGKFQIESNTISKGKCKRNMDEC